MKTFRLAALLALFLAVSPAVAQWQTPNHSIPIGRGGGTTGFGAMVPGTAGLPAVSTGSSTDPAFGQAVNAGIAPGAANTLKGSLNGTTTSDIAVPACTGLGQAIRWGAGVGPNCGTVVATTGFDMPINMGLSASVAATSLTLTVTQASGSAPTSDNPVVVPFRSTTATSGVVTTGTVSSTLSINVPSGATLGASSSNVPFRIWIFLNANGGTPALGVATCSNTTTIFPCVSWESTLKTSIAMSTGSDSAGVLYATAGVSSDAVRIVGYCDYANGLATAGSWVSACTTLQVMGPGVKKPGEVVQVLFTSTTTPGTTSSATFAALSSGLTQTITTTASPNLVRAHAFGSFQQATASTSSVQFARGSTLIGTPYLISTNAGTNLSLPLAMGLIDAPGTLGTSGATYGFQGKSSTGAIAYPSSSSDGGLSFELQEIQG